MVKIVLFLVLLLSFKVSAQDLFRKGEIEQKDFLEIVDFEIVKSKIIVPVSINNKMYRFLLDTGAPNIISERLQKELNLQTLEETLISDANNVADTMPVVELPKLDIGNLSFLNTTSLVSDLQNHPLLQCYTIDGFIGSNLFKDKVIKISLKENKLYITDKIKNLNPTTKGVKLKLFGNQHAPFIKVNLEGANGKKATEEVLIDTGMDGLYDISNRAFSVFKSQGIYTRTIQSSGAGSIGLFGNAEKQEQFQVTVPKFKIEKAILYNLSAHTMNDQNSRIGLELLEYGDIIIDFKKKKFYFENTSETQLKAPKKLGFILEDKTYIVDFVWDKQLREQIQYGDKVIRIDNLIIQGMDVCEILTIKEYLKNKNSYEIELLNNKNETIIIKIDQD